MPVCLAGGRKMHTKFSWSSLTRNLKRDVTTLWFALKHPQTPWLARVLAIVLTAYAFSPVDLIPDFIPVLGFLDDVILLPLLILLALRLMPPSVLVACRAQVQEWLDAGRAWPSSRWGSLLVVLMWLGAAAVLVGWLLGA